MQPIEVTVRGVRARIIDDGPDGYMVLNEAGYGLLKNGRFRSFREQNPRFAFFNSPADALAFVEKLNREAEPCGGCGEANEANRCIGCRHDFAPRVLEMCKRRDWSLHWTARGAYLHLEASELIEAIRGKHGDPLCEAADVLIVLMSITENAGIAWADVLAQAEKRVGELMLKPPYKGEEKASGAVPATPSPQAEQLKAKDAEIERLRGCEINLGALRPKLADCEDALRKANAENERLKDVIDSHAVSNRRLASIVNDSKALLHPEEQSCTNLADAVRITMKAYWQYKNRVAELESQLTSTQAALAAERERAEKLESAIREHWSQKNDDRCWEDDVKLYAAVPLPESTHHCIGDPAAMLENCKRFIDQRCVKGGLWKSYAELERELTTLRQQLADLQNKAAP